MFPIFPVADAHVDVLWRMEQEGVSFFGDSSALMAGYQKLQAGGVRTQVFALFTMPTGSAGAQLQSILRQIDLFHQGVVRPEQVLFVHNQVDYAQAQATNQIAALLSLEGGGCLAGETAYLRILSQLGVRGMGLTWNRANELADGCMEQRGAGLTEAGRNVVAELQRLRMWVDIAHLADAGVNDVFRCSDRPVMASHANSRQVFDHPRNLSDAVVRELIRRKGWMGLTFEASFVGFAHQATARDLLRHVDHLLDLGAENILGLGSDFDGTSNVLPGLTQASDYAGFADLLAARYGRNVAEKILFRNFDVFLRANLPS